MTARFVFRTASCLFLLAAIACGIIALRPLESGIRIPVHRANGTMGYIDSEGTMVLAGGWKTATPFDVNNLAVVTVEREPLQIALFLSRWIPSLHPFGRKRTEMYNIDRYGNTTVKVPARYAPLHRNAESTAEINLIRPGIYRWVLKDGSPAFPGSWKKALDFKGEDPAAVCEDGRWGFIDKNGKAVLPFQWDETLGFDGNGRACVAINWKWGVIDTSGQLIVPLYFQSLAGFDHQGMCAAQLKSGRGAIDRQGKIVVPFRYRKIGMFDKFDMAKVEISDSQGAIRCGWINRAGETVVPPIYDTKSPPWASSFRDHELLPVIDSKRQHLIDRKGRTVVPIARGMLKPIEDPTAPGRFWIRTAPHLDATPRKGVPRLPFEPVCYDQTGKLIWKDSQLTTNEMLMIGTVIAGLISLSLFSIGNRFRCPKVIHV